ncbi:type ISP restriction/modification enzyme [Stutzerimonas stutzeri]|uniref:type ISP restriction/modification enzyme n=1 Tax=Stutzerimonas stutzeri TaxID=316 RepID=UPI003AF3BE36
MLGDKKSNAPKLFENFSNGIKTQRDAWSYNCSKSGLAENISVMIQNFNQEVARFDLSHGTQAKKVKDELAPGFVDNNPKNISWTPNLLNDLVRGVRREFRPECQAIALYRPFFKEWLYNDKALVWSQYQIPKIFPTPDVVNRIIMVKQRWNGEGHLALMVDCPVDLQSDGGNQCFPLYLFDEAAQASKKDDLFAEPVEGGLRRRDAITDAGLAHFASAYPGEAIGKEDLFHYVYGILHSPDYRERFADNLSKELPRIPAVKKAADFWAFSKAGRALADLHLNYETVEPYPLTIEAKGTLTDADYRVEKMKFAKKGDKTTVIYNHRITLKGIPEAAWEYVVNGKAALDWVMERQAARTDKASGIVNDANDWANETMGNPKYPLELFQRVVTVSLETQKIVKALPALDIG